MLPSLCNGGHGNSDKPRETTVPSSWRSDSPLPYSQNPTNGWTFPKCVPKPLLLRIIGPTIYSQVNYSIYQTNSIQPNRQRIGSERAHPVCEEVSRVVKSLCDLSSCFLFGPGPRGGGLDVSSFPWWPPDIYIIGHLSSFSVVFSYHHKHFIRVHPFLRWGKYL